MPSVDLVEIGRVREEHQGPLSCSSIKYPRRIANRKIIGASSRLRMGRERVRAWGGRTGFKHSSDGLD